MLHKTSVRIGGVFLVPGVHLRVPDHPHHVPLFTIVFLCLLPLVFLRRRLPRAHPEETN